MSVEFRDSLIDKLGFRDLELWVPISRGRDLCRHLRQAEYGSSSAIDSRGSTLSATYQTLRWTSSADTPLPLPTTSRRLLPPPPPLRRPKSPSTWPGTRWLSTRGEAVTREFYVFPVTPFSLWIRLRFPSLIRTMWVVILKELLRSSGGTRPPVSLTSVCALMAVGSLKR